MQALQHADLYFNQDNTPVSAQFDDVYFNNQDGLAESRYVFLEGNDLWARWQQHNGTFFVIGESGFGTGLNFFAVTALFRQFRRQFTHLPLKRLFFLSFEQYPLSLEALQRAHQAYPEFADLALELQAQWLNPIAGGYRFHFDETTLDLWFGDINAQLPQLGDYMNEKVDAWFLDGFSPAKNPQMWTEHLYQQLFRLSKTDATLATFTAASAVRKGLEAAGFQMQKRKGYGKKREMLIGKKSQNPTALLPRFPWYLPQSALGVEAAKDVAIIGGGIASLCTALALQKRGANVTVYCQDPAPAQNASGNAQGAFYPQLSDDDLRNVRFYLHAFAYAGNQFRQWRKTADFGLEVCGVALCAYNDKTAAKLAAIAAQPLPDGLFRLMSAVALSEQVGLELPCGGGFFPDGGWLAPQQMVQNLFTYAQRQGLSLKTFQKVTALLPQGQGWLLETQCGQRIKHEIVVLANGHQLTEFAQCQHIPAYPVRGQVSQIPTNPTLAKLRSVLCYDGYLTPAANGLHCLGASHVRDCADRAFRPAEQQENQQRICQALNGAPWLADIDVSDNLARQGVRCALRDRMPLMGNVGNFAQQAQDYANLFNLRRRKQPIKSAVNFNNLFLLGALGSRGLTTAPLLGESLASLIYGEPLPLSEDLLHALSPNRSWLRKWLKGAPV